MEASAWSASASTANAEALATELQAIAGVVEHGLFIGLAQTVILGKATGAEVKEL